jgi:hypothetical protein
MSTCPSCAGKGRPWGSVALLLPVAAAGAGAVVVAVIKRRFVSDGVVVLVAAVFAVFIAALVRFGVRVAKGISCAGCGRDMRAG